jgi:sortase (surface protein transpeptidase)
VPPASIDIPKINAHSTLIPLGLEPDGSLKVPDVKHPKQASYFCVVDIDPGKVCSNGVVPGQPGPAVVVGHIDGAKQKGIFYDLPKMAVGDTATVTEANGKILTFSAYRVLETAKTQFPASVVYGDTVGPELRLISCTGKFVGGQTGYNDNIIVFMALVPNPPA